MLVHFSVILMHCSVILVHCLFHVSVILIDFKTIYVNSGRIAENRKDVKRQI